MGVTGAFWGSLQADLRRPLMNTHHECRPTIAGVVSDACSGGACAACGGGNGNGSTAAGSAGSAGDTIPR